MTEREWFGLFIRIGGLTLIVFGVFDLVHAVAVLLSLPIPSRYGILADLAGAAFYFAMGVFLIGGANLITRLVYGRHPKSD